MKYFFAFGFSLLALFSCESNKSLSLKYGQIITQSVSLKQDSFRINGTDSLNQPVLTIEGENIIVDFNGAVLTGSNDKEWPNEFYGLGILIKGKNITLKNAKVHGFKVAVMAQGVDSLNIIDCDFSYNYRQKLKSIREREDMSDWLSYHQNDKDEWLRYGMGIYMKNCDHAIVKNVHITGGQNGLMMMQCDSGLIYNNEINFNSGIGIGMYRSNRNRIMHNKLDWNVRGYSHGFYSRGQDSAGILVYEQSNENVFAYNSATHSGDGFFLWAGQTTMDTGEGGCNDNLIYGNDFSHAPTNGIEVTFSSNTIANNILNECRYGLWGGYSWKSTIFFNEIKDCEYGIAIEHGQNNTIEGNQIENTGVGIQLWEREKQPEDWGYAKKKDVSNKNHFIHTNYISNTDFPIQINSSDSITVDENYFSDFEKLLELKKENSNFSFTKNSVYQEINWGDATSMKNENNQLLEKEIPDAKNIMHVSIPVIFDPGIIEDGLNAILPETHPRGRQYILIDEWGPYNFKYPIIWLRDIQDNQYTFLLLGPQGNWKSVGGTGLKGFGPKTGTFPATIVAQKDPESDEISLELEFIGEAITDQFGMHYKKGTIFPFSFFRYEKTLNWNVQWHEYNEENEPLSNYESFKNLKSQIPQKVVTTTDLAYSWWGSPGNDINPDKFATFASTTFEIESGKYKIQITSDDGMKFFVDGDLLIDHWDIHVPATDEVIVELGGGHTFEIEHFEGGGFATLSFLMTKIR